MKSSYRTCGNISVKSPVLGPSLRLKFVSTHAQPYTYKAPAHRPGSPGADSAWPLPAARGLGTGLGRDTCDTAGKAGLRGGRLGPCHRKRRGWWRKWAEVGGRGRRWGWGPSVERVWRPTRKRFRKPSSVTQRECFLL